jgi:hypothetical protein
MNVVLSSECLPHAGDLQYTWLQRTTWVCGNVLERLKTLMIIIDLINMNTSFDIYGYMDKRHKNTYKQ